MRSPNDSPSPTSTMRNELESFARFFRSQSHALSVNPVLTFQQAINQPTGTTLRQAAERRLKDGRETRSWLRWLNAAHYADVCLMTIDAFQGSMAFSGALTSDGQKILCSDISGRVKLYDASNGTMLSTFEADSSRFEFSRDRRLAVWRTVQPDSIGAAETATLWDVTAGKEIGNVSAGESELTTLAAGFSADGPKIASGSSSGTLRVWNALTGIVEMINSDQVGVIDGLVFSPDGKHLISSDGEGVKLWDVTHRGKVSMLSANAFDSLDKYAFSPDGTRLAVVTSKNEITVWSTAEAKELATLRLHKGEVGFGAGLRFTRDGNLVAKVSYSSMRDDDPVSILEVWDPVSQEQLRDQYESYVGISCFAFSRDGGMVAAGSSNGTLEVWQTGGGSKVIRLDNHSGIVDCAFSSDASLLLTCSYDGTVKLWDVAIAKRLYEKWYEDFTQGRFRQRSLQSNRNLHQSGVSACDFVAGGPRLVSASSDETLVLWDTDEGTALDIKKGYSDEGVDGGCVVAPNGKQMAAVSQNGLGGWNICEPNSYQQTAYLESRHNLDASQLDRRYHYTSFVFLPQGDRIVASSDDGWFRILDHATGRELLKFAWRNRSKRVWCLSPDGTRLVTDARLKTLKLWDVNTGNDVGSFKGHSQRITTCEFSPDGATIISGSEDRTLRLWSIKGRPLHCFEGHTDSITRCVFSPDGTTILSASEDGKLKLWDAHTQDQRLTISSPDVVSETLMFSPDGQYFAAAEGKSIKIWDVPAGNEVCIYWVDRVARSLAWSADGRTLVAGDYLGWVHILRIENARHGPPVITTWHSPANANYGFGCPLCREWSEVSLLDLGNQVECPSCRRSVKLNQFTIEADWLTVAAAWRGLL